MYVPSVLSPPSLPVLPSRSSQRAGLGSGWYLATPGSLSQA